MVKVFMQKLRVIVNQFFQNWKRVSTKDIEVGSANSSKTQTFTERTPFLQ